MPPTRVLYLYDLDLPAPVAAPVQILKTAAELARQGASVTTAWADVGDVDTIYTQYGIEPHARLSVVPFFNRWTRWRLRAALRRMVGQFDVVMSRGETGLRLFEALRGLPAPPTFVYEVHRRAVAVRGLVAGMSLPRARGLEREAVRAADGLVCISAGIRDALQETHGYRTPTLVLPSGVDPPPEGPAVSRDIDLLYAGKLERRKGVPLMLDAMAHLPETLTLIGGQPGDVAALRTAVATRGLSQRVNALGYVAPGEVRSYFRRVRVGLCPLPVGVSEVSEKFTSPMKIMEMMACGTPIVATDVASVREILEHDVTALLVPPNDPAALAGGVRQLLDDPARAGRLADAALVRVRDYTWSERARKLLRFFETVRNS